MATAEHVDDERANDMRMQQVRSVEIVEELKKLNVLKEEGEENPDELLEIILDSWKSIVDGSETPWVLCDECYEDIKNIKSKSMEVARGSKVLACIR